MVSTKRRRFTNSLVDPKAGVISREIFVDEDVYQREQEQVFARSWLFIGHETQVQKPGDYFVSCMGEESVILSRDREDRIHAFLNSCRHRGMRVCRYDEGNTPIFTCPYHGWSYATDGKLVGVPYFKDAYHEKLDKSRWGLVEVAQLYNYKGSIWATWEPSAPPFLEYLGDMKLYLDHLLDCRDGREGGSEVIGGVQKWTMPANWKFPSENFAGDGYHNISHRSVDMVGIGPSGRGRRDDSEFTAARRVSFSFPTLGHAAVCDLQLQDVPYVPTYQNTPVAEEYFRHVFEERKRRLGDTSRLLGLVGTVFPNMSYLARQPRSIAVWHPRGPHKTEAWRWFLVDKDAPAEVKDTLRHYYVRYSGPAGMTEQDDMENWNYAHAASRGVIARRHPYNYEMGLGYKKTDAAYPGVATERINEENARGFYTRWAAVMDAKSWEDLPPNGRGSRAHKANGGGNGRPSK
jgi:phenylpropionate dioxygenase-like ring-hydroxylating dioxygenase large terminal subunit